MPSRSNDEVYDEIVTLKRMLQGDGGATHNTITGGTFDVVVQARNVGNLTYRAAEESPGRAGGGGAGGGGAASGGAAAAGQASRTAAQAMNNAAQAASNLTRNLASLRQEMSRVAQEAGED